MQTLNKLQQRQGAAVEEKVVRSALNKPVTILYLVSDSGYLWNCRVGNYSHEYETVFVGYL